MNAGGKTIVSICPTSLDRDTRTLKIAASFARMGFRSVVVENLPSSRRYGHLGIETVSLPRPLARWTAGLATRPVHGQTARSQASSSGDLPLILRFLFLYFVHRPLFCASLVPDAALYYLHEYRMFPMTAKAARRNGAPIFYDAHDFYMDVFERETLSPVWRRVFLPLLRRMERACLAASETCVTVGGGVAGLYEEAFGVRPTVLMNSHDVRLEAPTSRDLRADARCADSDVLIVIVGNKKPGQLVEPMIDALHALPANVRVAFVGRFHESTAAYAEARGLADRVAAVGAVPPDEVVPYIRSADIGAVLYFPVTSNVRCILPNGFFQTLVAGLPVIYPNLPELTAQTRGVNVGAVVDVTSAASIAAGVEHVLGQTGRDGQEDNGIDLLAKRLAWDQQEILLQRLLDEAGVRAD